MLSLEQARSTGSFCESSLAGMTVLCLREDSRFRGNDSFGDGIVYFTSFSNLLVCSYNDL
jgi:hypothetical protein